MSFDLGQVAYQDEARPMEVLDAKGSPARNSAGEAVVIRLFGRFSEAYQKVSRENSNRRLARTTDATPTREEIEAENTELLVACTAGWNFETLDGQPFPYSEQNARRLWDDKRFRPLRDQAIGFIANDGRFLKG